MLVGMARMAGPVQLLGSGLTKGNIKLIKDLVDADGRLTIDEMVEETGLKRSTIHLIFKVNLGYSKFNSPAS